MKKIVLIRHAKSSWDHKVSDFDRPLNERGKTDAPLMGGVLKQLAIRPDLYLCSPAKRAFTTAQKLCEAMDLNKDIIKTENSIYLASYQTLIKIISLQPAEINTLFITGHNPGFTDLANHLSEARIDNLPTCGIFAVDFDMAHWSEISANTGSFSFFEYPKKHK